MAYIERPENSRKANFGPNNNQENQASKSNAPT